MRKSLIVSLAMHGLVLTVALVSFRAHQGTDTLTPVSVDIVAPAAISATKAGKSDQETDKADKRAAQLDHEPNIVQTTAELNPAPKDAKKDAALPPPKPQSRSSTPEDIPAKQDIQTTKAAPEPKTMDVPPPAKRIARQMPARQETRREDRPPPRQREREKRDRLAELINRPRLQATGKSDFDPKRISALLDRDPTAGERASLDGPREPWRRPSTFEEQAAGLDEEPGKRFTYGAPDGRDARMSASEIDAFRAQISRCWTPPVGGLGGDAIIVKLRITLDEDGSLSRPPAISNSFDSPFFRPAADAAVRAVMQCQPYRMMPPEKYEQWRDMLLSFDPSRMYGG